MLYMLGRSHYQIMQDNKKKCKISAVNCSVQWWRHFNQATDIHEMKTNKKFWLTQHFMLTHNNKV